LNFLLKLVKLKQNEDTQDSKLSIGNDINESIRRNDSMTKEKTNIEKEKKINEDYTIINQIPNQPEKITIGSIPNIYDPIHLNYFQSKKIHVRNFFNKI